MIATSMATLFATVSNGYSNGYVRIAMIMVQAGVGTVTATSTITWYINHNFQLRLSSTWMCSTCSQRLLNTHMKKSCIYNWWSCTRFDTQGCIRITETNNSNKLQEIVRKYTIDTFTNFFTAHKQKSQTQDRYQHFLRPSLWVWKSANCILLKKSLKFVRIINGISSHGAMVCETMLPCQLWALTWLRTQIKWSMICKNDSSLWCLSNVASGKKFVSYKCDGHEK